jgi:hypothetical protein
VRVVESQTSQPVPVVDVASTPLPSATQGALGEPHGTDDVRDGGPEANSWRSRGSVCLRATSCVIQNA